MANQVFNARVDLLYSTTTEDPSIFIIEANIVDGTAQFGAASILVGDSIYLDTFNSNATVSKYKVTEILGTAGVYFTGKIQYVDTGDVVDPNALSMGVGASNGYICSVSPAHKFSWHSAPTVHTFPDYITQYARDQELFSLIENISVTGPQGVQGYTGVDGSTGVIGVAGATGIAGTAGAAGATGVAGIAGEAGATGVAGEAGAAGATGVAGTAGAAGATGVAGTAGAAGVTGVAGTAGAAGVTGVAGTAGAAGVTGVAGTAGAAGATGVGVQGATGVGSTGDQGVTGVSGDQGATGVAAGGGEGVRTLTFLSGTVAVRAAGLLTDLASVTVTKDYSVSAVSRCILGVPSGVEILEVHCTFTAAETAGRTEVRVEVPDPAGAASLANAFRPYAVKWSSIYGKTTDASSISMNAGVLVVALTAYTQSAEQKMSVWV